MKAFAIAVLVCSAFCGCRTPSTPPGKIVVTTPTGRKEQVTRRYTIAEIEQGARTSKAPANPFAIQHPVYPQRKDVEELSRHFRAGDEIWYFQGLDSGWALVRGGQVAWLLVTHHEY